MCVFNFTRFLSALPFSYFLSFSLAFLHVAVKLVSPLRLPRYFPLLILSLSLSLSLPPPLLWTLDLKRFLGQFLLHVIGEFFFCFLFFCFFVFPLNIYCSLNIPFCLVCFMVSCKSGLGLLVCEFV